MASNFNGAAAWAEREAQKSKGFDGATAWAERESAKAKEQSLAYTANTTNRMLAGSDIMGRITPPAETKPTRTGDEIRTELSAVQDELANTYGTVRFGMEAENAKKQEELKAQEKALKAELEAAEPTNAQKVGLALKSIGNANVGSLWSLGETAVQGAKNTVEEFQDDEYRTTLSDLTAAKEKLRFAERSKNMSAKAMSDYEAALAEVNRLQTKLDSLQVKTSVGADSLGQKTLAKANEQKEAALQGTEGVGRWVGENLIGVAQNASMLPLAAVNPTLPAVAMGTIAAGSKAAELNAQGVAPGEALIRGGVAGGIEALTEKIPLDNILDMVKVGGKSAIKNLLKQAGTEAGEESISYVLNYIADKAAGDPNATFSLEELANAAASGAFSGGIMGGGATLIGNTINQSVPSKVNIDNANASGYTNNANGGVVNGSQLHGTSGEGVRAGRDGSPLNQNQPAERSLRQGDLRDSGVVLLSDKSKSILTERGVVPVEYSNSIGNADFSSALERARTADQRNGWAVSPQSAEELDKYGTKTYLSSNGSSGFGVTPDGDIIGAFSNKSEGAPKGILKSLLPQAIAAGGTKLDCYGDILLSLYAEYGFTPVARVEFNPEYANPGWTPDKGTPYVYVMMHNGDSADTVIENIGKYQSYTKEQLDSLPTYGKDSYDEAIAYRDGLIEKRFSKPFVPPIAPKPEPVLPPTVKKDSSVGAAPTGFDPYSDAQLKYGNLKPGENPARIVDNPASTDGVNKVSQTVQTATEAKATPDSMVGPIQEKTLKGKNGFTYIPITNKETAARAEQAIQKDGFETALREWTASVRRGLVSADLTAMGATLYNSAVNAVDGKLAINILSDYASMVRSGAQATQAARILKTLTPEGKLYYAQKSVQRIQEELDQKFGEGKYNITISEELANSYLAAETEEARNAALDAIYKDVAKQIPATLAEKWNAWRYFAMLANPRTHIRNIAGNALFTPFRLIKDAIATVGESTVDYLSKNGIERTKAALNFASEADRALVKSAFADSANVEELLLGEGKYDSATDIIQDNRRIFAIGPLEAMRNFNNTALEKEDAIFSKTAYAGALAGYLKANGVTIETASKELLDKARAYAIKEAQKATYRDANALSDFVVKHTKFSGDSGLSKAANVLAEGVLPFRRTPANILARGLEYSPVGLVKGLTADLVKVHKGEMTAAEAIDNISAGLTGTGLVALGFFLAKQGRVTGGESGSEEEKEMRDLTGGQNYAIAFGDKNFTLDWLAPEAMPFFVGVELYNQLADKDNGTGRAMEDGWKSIGSIAAPVMEMSMLSGVQDLLESISYADGIEMIPAIISTAATNYVSQAFPTLFGQIERVGENERQTTFVDRTSMLTNDMQYTLGKVMNKAPKEFQQIPYIDAWGRTEESGTTGEKIVGNMLAPWYSSKENVTEADKEIMRLLDAGYKGVAPNRVEQSYEVTYKDNPEDKDAPNKSRYMTADEYVEFSKIKGQTSFDIVSEMIGNDIYANMTDEEKADALALAYTYANHIASSEITGGKHVMDKKHELAQTADKELGVSEAEYLLLCEKYGTESVNGDNVRKAYNDGMEVEDFLSYTTGKKAYNTDGKQGYTNKETKAAIKGSGLSKDDQTTLWLIENPEWGKAAEKHGVKAPLYVDFKVATMGIESDKDKNGKPISGSEKKKVVRAINGLRATKSEKDKLYLAAGYAESGLKSVPWR